MTSAGADAVLVMEDALLLNSQRGRASQTSPPRTGCP